MILLVLEGVYREDGKQNRKQIMFNQLTKTIKVVVSVNKMPPL
jgi:hypothetical protein